MTRADLEALAGRVEQASGPDRELDGAIEALFTDEHGTRPLSHFREWIVSGHHRPLRFTASLDAAMTLVPEGCGYFIGWGQTRPDEPMGGARITRNARFCGYEANYDAIVDAEAATPALALTAAALRAHAKEVE